MTGIVLSKARRISAATVNMRRRWKPLAEWLIRRGTRMIGCCLPLALRKAIVVSAVCRASRAGLGISTGLLDDLRRRDPNGFHRFLWSNHLAYARTYEVHKRFGIANLNPSRRILFDDIASHLHSRGIDPRRGIGSVFEVGCSMGYLLRHLEVEVCPSAEVLLGVDIDEYAVETGMRHLASLGSKVKLFAADMAGMDRIINHQTYDMILCCGVLMYVNESVAEHVIRTMLAHAKLLVGIICLAPPRLRGVNLSPSMKRPQDGAFIHDVGRMIGAAGGKVASVRLVGTEISGSSPSYAILSQPRGDRK
jgi:SAM-dependent methyltransferase